MKVSEINVGIKFWVISKNNFTLEESEIRGFELYRPSLPMGLVGSRTFMPDEDTGVMIKSLRGSFVFCFHKGDKTNVSDIDNGGTAFFKANEARKALEVCINQEISECEKRIEKEEKRIKELTTKYK